MKTTQAKTTTKSPCFLSHRVCPLAKSPCLEKKDIAPGHRLDKLAAQKRPFHKTSLLPQVKGRGFQFTDVKSVSKRGGGGRDKFEGAGKRRVARPNPPNNTERPK